MSNIIFLFKHHSIIPLSGSHNAWLNVSYDDSHIKYYHHCSIMTSYTSGFTKPYFTIL